MSAVLVLLAMALLPLFWAVGAYNRLARLRKRYRNAFADIGTQCKRRHDLIAELVQQSGAGIESAHEAHDMPATLLAARDQAAAAHAADPADAAALRRLAAAEHVLAFTLAKMLAQPDPDGGRRNPQLLHELAAIADRIAFARHAYNESVAQYNASLGQFPVSVIANMFAFRSAAPLPSTAAAERRSAARAAS